MAKHTAWVLLVLVAGLAQADIYSYRAEDGSIVFTDEPRKGAKTVKVEKPMTVPAMKKKRASTSAPMWPEPEAESKPGDSAQNEGDTGYDDSANTSWSSSTQGITSNRSKSKSSTKKKKAASYQKLSIVSPTAGSSRWVGGELTVEMSLTPRLQPEHVISLRVDGREVAVGPDMQVVVPNIERGGHTLRAAVIDVDSGKQLIVSKKIQFQVHRPNKNQNPRMLHPSVRSQKN